MTSETGSFMESEASLDLYPPTLTAPADITIEATGADGISRGDPLIAAFLADVEVSDLVDGPLSKCENESDHKGCWWSDIPETLSIDTYIVTFYAADNAGNEADPATATIEVKRETGIVLSKDTASVSEDWTPSHLASIDGVFNRPHVVAVGPDGSVFVADTRYNRIQKFTSGYLLFEGEFVRKWGTEGTGDGEFDYPRGVAVASDGSVYVADTRNNRIQKFTSEGVFVSKWGTGDSGDGEFNHPYGVAVAFDGSVYVSDRNNSRIQQFTSEGVFVGKWGAEGTGDGEFLGPEGVAVASDGSVYVAESEGNRIQKFAPGP